MKKVVFIIVFLYVSFSLSAQNQYTGALLWKISGKDMKKPSYIVGTHHAVPGTYIDSISGLTQTIKQVKQVIGEIDMSDMATITAVVLRYSLMPEGYSYKTMLSDNEYNLLDKVLTEHVGVGLNQLQGLHPAAINTLLVQLFCSKIFPEFLNPNFEQIDSYIQKIAQNQKKKILGLETVEEQFDLLYNGEPIEVQVKNLLCLVKSQEEAMDELIEITEIYYKKQLNKLSAYLERYEKEDNSDDDCTYSQSYLDGLNKTRNDKWLTILPQLMKNKSSLIVVGAMHLAGEDGLLYKLDKMGYTVEAILE